MRGFFADHKGRYNNKSLIAAVRRRDEDLYGPFLTKNDPWSPEADSMLAEFFLLEYPLVGEKSLIACLKRSRDSVQTRYRKICIHFPGMNEARLHAIPRNDRTGLPLSNHDLYAIGLATGPGGKKYGACRNNLDYLASNLGRDTDDMWEKMQMILTHNIWGVKKGFFGTDVRKVKEYSLQKLVEEVGRQLHKGREDFARKFFIKE